MEISKEVEEKQKLKLAIYDEAEISCLKCLQSNRSSNVYWEPANQENILQGFSFFRQFSSMHQKFIFTITKSPLMYVAVWLSN